MDRRKQVLFRKTVGAGFSSAKELKNDLKTSNYEM